MLIRPDILLCLLIIVFVHSCIHYCLGIDLWQVPVKLSSCHVLIVQSIRLIMISENSVPFKQSLTSN